MEQNKENMIKHLKEAIKEIKKAPKNAIPVATIIQWSQSENRFRGDNHFLLS